MRQDIAPLLLIIEDEADLVTLLQYNLGHAGFRTQFALNGADGLAAARAEQPDLILLDWMLPDITGVEICRKLRHHVTLQDIPIIMLTARDEEKDRVSGLNAGADDYVTKPFSVAELIARVNSVLRRAPRQKKERQLVQGDLTLDLTAHQVTRKGEAVHLGPTEFRLLRYFMENPGQVFSREQILRQVWGHDLHVEVRTVDVHIRRLRRALTGENFADPIRTIRSAGYAFDNSTPEAA